MFCILTILIFRIIREKIEEFINFVWSTPPAGSQQILLTFEPSKTKEFQKTSKRKHDTDQSLIFGRPFFAALWKSGLYFTQILQTLWGDQEVVVVLQVDKDIAANTRKEGRAQDPDQK